MLVLRKLLAIKYDLNKDYNMEDCGRI